VEQDAEMGLAETVFKNPAVKRILAEKMPGVALRQQLVQKLAQTDQWAPEKALEKLAEETNHGHLWIELLPGLPLAPQHRAPQHRAPQHLDPPPHDPTTIDDLLNPSRVAEPERLLAKFKRLLVLEAPIQGVDKTPRLPKKTLD